MLHKLGQTQRREYISSAYPFHLQQTVNKPKELQQQQQASITDPSCGSSHLAHDSEANSGAAFCYSQGTPLLRQKASLGVVGGRSLFPCGMVQDCNQKDGPSAILFPS